MITKIILVGGQLIFAGLISLGSLVLISNYYCPFHSNHGISENAKTVFKQRCASCHAIEDEGQEKIGPSLSNIGKIGSQRRKGMSSEEYILESILKPSAFRAPNAKGMMPTNITSGLDPQTIRELVVFLASQGANPDLAKIGSLKIESGKDNGIKRSGDKIPSLKSIFKGKEIFLTKGKCISCHSLRKGGLGNLVAPNLLQVGFLSREYLRESLLNPNKVVDPQYFQTNLPLKNGKIISGRILRQENEFLDLLVQDYSGHFNSIKISIQDVDLSAEEIQKSISHERSSMPENYSKTLTKDEIESLLDFMQVLKEDWEPVD